MMVLLYVTTHLYGRPEIVTYVSALCTPPATRWRATTKGDANGWRQFLFVFVTRYR